MIQVKLPTIAESASIARDDLAAVQVAINQINNILGAPQNQGKGWISRLLPMVT
jgi:hypothetical protein